MSELDRREFIAFVGKACAGTAALRGVTGAEPASGGQERAAGITESTLARQANGRAIYRGRHLANVSLPLGGLGAGSVALTGRGSLRAWQIFNVCNPQAQLAGSFFAIRAQAEGGPVVAKVLQTDPIGKLPTVDDTEFEGEYPFGWVTYKDANLPIAVRLEAYSPCIPMNAEDSGIPGAAFRFRVKNPGPVPVNVSLAGTCQNGVGFDGYNSFDEANGNVNLYRKNNGLHTLRMTGDYVSNGLGFTTPTVIYAESRQAARILRYYRNAELRFHESLADLPNGIPTRTTATIGAQRGTPPQGKVLPENAAFDTPDAPVIAFVDEIDPARNFPVLEKFVASGGTLIVLGPSRTLLEAAIAPDTDTTAIVFDDFEGAAYDPAKWAVEGEAFGTAPAHGTFPGQQAVSGFQGQGFVNSWNGSDEKTGCMTSKPFAVSRRYVHFLLGGGNHPNETCLNLRVGGKIVRTQTGRNEEKLRPERWDVTEFAGQQAVLEIVDTRRDGWGHINVDQIVFSDSPLPPALLTPELKKRLRDFLPFTYTGLENTATGVNLVGLARKPGRDDLKFIVDESRKKVLVSWRSGNGTERARVCFMLPTRGETWFADLPYPKRKQILAQWTSEAMGRHVAGALRSDKTGLDAAHPLAGSMALATNAPHTTHRAQWNDLEAFWSAFVDDGRLKPSETQAAPIGQTWNGALAAHVWLKPGEEREIVFWLGWHFPNRYRDRPQDVGFGGSIAEYEVKYRLGNYYNNLVSDADEVVEYLHHHDARLHAETKRFHAALFDGNLPYVIREAVASNIAILRSPTSMWLEDGSWMAYEGLGCCPMNCTHVYNYSQTLAHLWPELERSVREIDLTVQLQEDGGVRHRTQLPLDGPRFTGPFTDGHLSTISKAYREHRQSKDNTFLKRHWPAIKKAMEYAVREYDKNGDGVIEGRQPNTYDCDVYGPNSFITTQYLAALRAAERMAMEMGESETAQRYHTLFENGSRNLDATCWNGDYYQQNFPDYAKTPTQYGPGCLSDQLLGQWWSHVNGLGHLLPPEMVKTALQSVVRHNFVPDFTGYDYEGWRVFADGKEAGLIVCSWPKGGKPTQAAPLLYHTEVFTGIEYQVAAHLLYEGLTDDALKILMALRARYDGAKRNPFDEIECSTFYGRAMASWSVLLAASGVAYHGPSGFLAFAPRPELCGSDARYDNLVRAFFTTAEGWGTYTQRQAKPIQNRQTPQERIIALDYGTLALKTLQVALSDSAAKQNVMIRVTVNGRRLPCHAELVSDGKAVRVTFPNPLTLRAGQSLAVSVPG